MRGIDRRYSLFSVVSSNRSARMSQPTSVAASLPPTSRKSMAIEVLSQAEPVSHLAAQHQVSRKFLYQQRQKADKALDVAFSSSKDEPEVLFYLPITKTWLFQLILALILICHCSYRGVVELLRDLFDLPISGRFTIGFSPLLTKPPQLILPKIYLQLEWVCTMKSSREVNPYWWESMLSRLTATC